MHRRSWLKLGLAGATMLALGGGAVAVVSGPGVVHGHLSADARTVMRAIAVAILDGSLPKEESVRDSALEGYLDRVDALVSGLPQHAQQELSQLLALLASTAGRRLVAGVPQEWPAASVASVQDALQSMRTSSITLRQQAYHGLHDLTGAAYFSDGATWPMLGYPGPIAVTGA